MRGLLALLVLAGCATLQADAPPVTMMPVATGFAVGSSGLEIGFGRAAKGAITAMEKLAGPGRVQEGTDCRVVSWPGGLQAHFSPDFSGWKLGDDSAGRLCHRS